MLLLQFLENNVAVELTRSEFVEAQEVHRTAYPYFLLIRRMTAQGKFATVLRYSSMYMLFKYTCPIF